MAANGFRKTLKIFIFKYGWLLPKLLTERVKSDFLRNHQHIAMKSAIRGLEPGKKSIRIHYNPERWVEKLPIHDYDATGLKHVLIRGLDGAIKI